MSDQSKSSASRSPRPRRRGDARAGAAPGAAATWSQVGLTELILSQWRAEKPQVDGRGFEIGTLLTRLTILLNQMGTPAARGRGLRSAEIRLLYALRRVGPPFAQRPTDLFRLLGVTSGAVTYTVGLLKAQGLVEGADDPRDGRSQMVRLTAAGLALIDAVVEETASLLDVALSPIPEGELALIQQGLYRLAACLEAFTDQQAKLQVSKVEDKPV